MESQLPAGMTGEKLKELERGQVTEPGPETPTPKEPPKFITHVSRLRLRPLINSLSQGSRL